MNFHPLSNLFPLMRGEAFEALKRDISENGLREPIVTTNGEILDGRNRWRACDESGCEPMFVEWAERWENDSPLAFVISMNVHRRHLKESQRAMAGDALATLPHGVRSDTAGAVSAITQGQAAQLLSTSIDSIQRARHVRERGVDELIAAVVDGIIEVKPAARLADKPAEFQREVVSKAATNGNGLNVAQLIKEYERNLKRAANAELIETTGHYSLSTLSGCNFSTVVIDPPWDASVSDDNDIMGRSRPTYATMSLAEIAALPVGDVAAPNAHIYLWVTNRVLPLAFELLDAWDFRYVTTVTWCKPSIGMGNYFRGSTEHVLFGVRGELSILRRDVGTWFLAPRGDAKHSAKPTEFFTLVEECSPGPWVELFSRTARQGWASWGAESGV